MTQPKLNSSADLLAGAMRKVFGEIAEEHAFSISAVDKEPESGFVETRSTLETS